MDNMLRNIHSEQSPPLFINGFFRIPDSVLTKQLDFLYALRDML